MGVSIIYLNISFYTQGFSLQTVVLEMPRGIYRAALPRQESFLVSCPFGFNNLIWGIRVAAARLFGITICFFKVD